MSRIRLLVAVDNIFARCARAYKTFNRINENTTGTTPLTRLFSQSQIEAEYLAKDSILDHPCPTEVKKLAFATKHKITNFLTGRQTLMDNDIILNDELVKNYYGESRRFTREIMTIFRAVFCTTAAIRDRALYRVEDTGEIKT